MVRISYISKSYVENSGWKKPKASWEANIRKRMKIEDLVGYSEWGQEESHRLEYGGKEREGDDWE